VRRQNSMPACHRSRSGERGFSLLELIVAVAILMVVIGVAVRGMTEMQRIDFTQHEQTDAVQETRDFIDQMVRDLHDVGYPPRVVFLNKPLCATDARISCSVTYFSPTELQYEGDLDGTGTVYHVWVQLQPGPGNQCPCLLQRGVITKALYLANNTPTYFTQVTGVINSGDGAGNATYSVALPGNGNYATYGTTDIFQAFDTNANQITTSCAGATNCSNIASLKITLNSVSKYADQKTNTFKVYSITSRARVNNSQFDN
jgi:prepilin-type N-terminal cleavage/methylation domain-containing protein